MSGLRERILERFTPRLTPITIAEDPDELLRDEAVLAALRRRGFEMLFVRDPMEFRFAYESGFRAAWDAGEALELVVVTSGDADSAPFDLRDGCETVSLQLGDLFPRMSAAVVAELEPRDREALFAVQAEAGVRTLGDDETRDFVLSRVFDLATEAVDTPPDLLRLLLRKHYAGRRLPPSLDRHLIRRLRHRERFGGWPLAQIVPDREAFLAFLQERWPLFVDRVAPTSADPKARCDLVIPGPTDLPFDHPDAGPYTGNLFLEGFLKPVEHRDAAALQQAWIRVGIVFDEQKAARDRIAGLARIAREALPVPDADHVAWRRFARTWAELLAAMYGLEELSPGELRQEFTRLEQDTDAAFDAWLEDRYGGLSSLPPDPPVMLHHVPRVLARHVTDTDRRAALLVVDGLALHQWAIVRQELARQRPEYRVREDAVFAWIPTLTSFSRQAAFAGHPPFHFRNSIQTTALEPRLWGRFWRSEGLGEGQIGYARRLGDGPLDEVERRLDSGTCRALGLVVDKVDRIMHGAELGQRGMHIQVAQWAREAFLTRLLDLLLDHGFAVWLTSDHGNIEATGCGQPAEGAVADLRGERVRTYGDEVLRTRIAKQFPAARKWPPIGLPGNCLPLLAPERRAFVAEGRTIVAHGGTSLEEVIVPLIRIERPKR